MSDQMEQILSSGMKPREAARRASQWWDQTGRHLIPKALNEERTKDKVLAAGKRAPAMVIKGTVQPVLQSGILNGRPFDDLSRDEKLQVVKHWHEHFVVSVQ